VAVVVDYFCVPLNVLCASAVHCDGSKPLDPANSVFVDLPWQEGVL
jgi:hypothetical protein